MGSAEHERTPQRAAAREVDGPSRMPIDSDLLVPPPTRGSSSSLVVVGVIGLIAAVIYGVSGGFDSLLQPASAEEASPAKGVEDDASKAAVARAPEASKAATKAAPSPEERDATGAAADPAIDETPEERSPADRRVDERIAALEEKAEASWGRGDLRGARNSFKEITRIGGERRSVEVAYGELFSLTAQLGGDVRGLWRAYLEQFPQGLYAEDATAGLCGVARGAERERCWEEYRVKFPSGSHRDGASEGRPSE
ncbi:MAG: hypothetical protein KC636_36035 [Myxococcales bacterium]|nr:hypothetical protein [Myxococcales bacterium]